MDNWNLLGIYNEIIDVIGCVIRNIEKKDVYIESNAHNQLIRPYEHSNKFHREKETNSQKVWSAFHIQHFLYCWYHSLLVLYHFCSIIFIFIFSFIFFLFLSFSRHLLHDFTKTNNMYCHMHKKYILRKIYFKLLQPPINILVCLVKFH